MLLLTMPQMSFNQWREYIRKELLITKLKNMNYEKDERI